MPTLKAAIAVKPGDCFDHWHQVTCRDFSVTECDRVSDRHFRARVSICPFGALAINDIWSSTAADERIRVTRSPSDIRKDPRDYFMLWVALGGEATLTQDGREARMRPGDLALHDQSRPFVLQFGQRSRAIMISIPRPLLISRLPIAPQLSARRIPRESKFGALAGSIARRLAGLDETTPDAVVSRLGASALDIFATTLEAELTEQISGSVHEKRLVHAKRFILANLHDSSLDLETIARAQNMAPRTLNRLFAGEGTTPIRWLWQQRLAASFKALTEGQVSQVTDAALSFGFSDLSHFSRAFKSAFGQSPHTIKRRNNV
jgi:AraC-like DNA-binding protein